MAINQAHEAPLCTEANSNFAREFTEGNTHKTHGEQLPANPNLRHGAPPLFPLLVTNCKTVK